MEISLIQIAIGSLLGIIIGWVLNLLLSEKNLNEAKRKKKQILEDAEIEIDDLKKETLLKIQEDNNVYRQSLDQEYVEKSSSLKKTERDLNEREVHIEKKVEYVNKKEEEFKFEKLSIENEKRKVTEAKSHYKDLIDKVNLRLEEISGITKDEALEILKENLINEAKKQTGKVISDILDEAQHTANRQAKDIVLQAIYQCSSDQSVESTVSVINLPDDSMKGRIIGREGRNIRSFEMASGCDVLIDDTPQMIVVSCYDPMRREIGKIALERLIEDGRIHPARIEEMIEKVESEMDDLNFEKGEQAIFDLGIHTMHRDLTALIGKLRFRTLSGQNLLSHCKEVAEISAIITTELGIEKHQVKRAALLHEIGRTIDKIDISVHERTLEVLRKFGENQTIIDLIEDLSDDFVKEVRNPLSYVIAAAKAISSSRPGARRDVYEQYVKRLQNMEEMALSFEGVNSAFAIQAGREVRVMIDCDLIEDANSKVLANNLCQKIEKEMEYPGQIKVSVHREYRAYEYAK